MKQPQTFRYMSQTYHIKNEPLRSTSGDEESFRMGEVRWHLNEIGLHEDNTPECNRDTLLHEIVHVILGMNFSGGETEMVVDVVTRGMVHVIRENPDIIKYIQEEG